MDLNGSIALITGGSSGIGRAIAERLAAEGARVVVHGRDRQRTEEAAARVQGVWVTGDLASPDGARVLARKVLDEHGHVDLLVASAGLGWSGPFVKMPEDTVGELVAVDLLAPLLLTRALAPAMVARGAGRIVLVSSVAGRTGVAGEAVYAACKAGLDAFAESLRLELRDTGVGVTVVVPGAVDTPFFERRGRAYERRVPRPVSADDVAQQTIRAIGRGDAEAWVPGWLRIAPTVRALAPGAYRRLAGRYGEPVRAPGARS